MMTNLAERLMTDKVKWNKSTASLTDDMHTMMNSFDSIKLSSDFIKGRLRFWFMFLVFKSSSYYSTNGKSHSQ